MLLRVLARLLLGGLPRLVHLRRPIPVVWHDRWARRRAPEHLTRLAGALARPEVAPHPWIAATYAGDGIPPTSTASGTTGGASAVLVSTR
jgi:hypothetical protein